MLYSTDTMPNYSRVAIHPERWSKEIVLRRFIIPHHCGPWLKNVYSTKYPEQREGFVLECAVDTG